MKKTSAFILCIAVLLASSFAAYARPHHSFHHHPAPAVHYSHPHHHHHYRGPSRGWYNGALIVGATLAGLELVSEIARPPQTTVVEKTVQVPVVQQPQVVYVQQPQPAAMQQPQPVVIQQPVVVPQPQPVVVSPLPQASAPAKEQWVILPNGSAVKFK